MLRTLAGTKSWSSSPCFSDAFVKHLCRTFLVKLSKYNFLNVALCGKNLFTTITTLRWPPSRMSWPASNDSRWEKITLLRNRLSELHPDHWYPAHETWHRCHCKVQESPRWPTFSRKKVAKWNNGHPLCSLWLEACCVIWIRRGPTKPTEIKLGPYQINITTETFIKIH